MFGVGGVTFVVAVRFRFVVGVCGRGDESCMPTIVRGSGQHAAGLWAGQAHVRHDSDQVAALEAACRCGLLGAWVVL